MDRTLLILLPDACGAGAREVALLMVAADEPLTGAHVVKANVIVAIRNLLKNISAGRVNVRILACRHFTKSI